MFGVFAAAMLGSTAAALATRTYEFLFYIGVLVVIAGVVLTVHRRVGLTIGTLWGLMAWAAAHVCGGMVPMPEPTGVLYNLWIVPERLRYDHVVHAYGFGITTWVCWQALRARLAAGGDARPTAGMVLLAVLASMGLGALNEEIEFAATKLVEKTNVGGYENNAWDLVANMAGALIAGAIIWARGR